MFMIKIDFWELDVVSINSGVVKKILVEKFFVNKLKFKYKIEWFRSYSNSFRDVVMINNLEVIFRIVKEEGVKVNEMSKNGVLLIYEVVFDGKLECVKVLLDCGV